MTSSLRRFSVVFTCALLLVPGAFAQSSRRGSKPAASADDLEAIRQMLEQQQAEIRQMRQEMQRRDEAMRQLQQQLQQAQAAAAAAQQKAASVETAAGEQSGSVAKLAGDVADIQTTLTNTAVNTQEEQQRLAGIEGLLGRFRWKGDVRLRGESFNQGDRPDRYRGRFRLRFGFEGKLGEDFTGGIYMASGANAGPLASFSDPVSTNQTMTNFFERKTIGFDRGWITYNPSAFKPLSLTGGKFAPTWIRTPLTFDSDLNPEGFSEQLSFDFENPSFKNVTFTAMQILFNESGSGADSFATGGQVSTKLQFGSRVSVTPAVSFLKWNNEDRIATAILGGDVGGSVSSSNLQNALNGSGTGYLSGFFYSDYILKTGVKTPWKRFPFNLTLEFEHNLDAATDQADAFYSEASFGQTRNRNDFEFGYGFARVEQDAVLAAFNESDWRAQTNVSQHKFFFSWKAQSNTTIGYTLWLGRFLDPAIAGLATQEDHLKRGQLDLIYSF